MKINSLGNKDANRPYNNKYSKVNLNLNEIDNIDHKNRSNINNDHIKFN